MALAAFPKDFPVTHPSRYLPVFLKHCGNILLGATSLSAAREFSENARPHERHCVQLSVPLFDHRTKKDYAFPAANQTDTRVYRQNIPTGTAAGTYRTHLPVAPSQLDGSSDFICCKVPKEQHRALYRALIVKLIGRKGTRWKQLQEKFTH